MLEVTVVWWIKSLHFDTAFEPSALSDNFKQSVSKKMIWRLRDKILFTRFRVCKLLNLE
jgi:hypothetical protein